MYIAIAGPPCSGKTTLARMLVNKLDFALLPRMIGCNTNDQVLEIFTRTPQTVGLAKELYFLAGRYYQIQNGIVLNMFVKSVVSDFFFNAEVSYARTSLAPSQFRI